MPLIQITTIPRLHPWSTSRGNSGNTAAQQMTIDLGKALPGLLVGKAKKLRLEKGTPEVAVQVTHRKFHGQDVNTPDMWLVVQFSEDGLDEVQRTKVVSNLKKILIGWFKDNGHAVPENIACDCFWGPTHGFLSIQGVQSDW